MGSGRGVSSYVVHPYLLDESSLHLASLPLGSGDEVVRGVMSKGLT